MYLFLTALAYLLPATYLFIFQRVFTIHLLHSLPQAITYFILRQKSFKIYAKIQNRLQKMFLWKFLIHSLKSVHRKMWKINTPTLIKEPRSNIINVLNFPVEFYFYCVLISRFPSFPFLSSLFLSAMVPHFTHFLKNLFEIFNIRNFLAEFWSIVF